MTALLFKWCPICQHYICQGTNFWCQCP